MNEDNDRNRLQELVQNLGHPTDAITYREVAREHDGLPFRAEVTVTFGDALVVVGVGSGPSKKSAAAAAAGDALARIGAEHPDLVVDWEDVRIRALAGDALFKLSVYTARGLGSPEMRSRILQVQETDTNFAAAFDALRADGLDAFRGFGPTLSTVRRAGLVEAWMWDTYKDRVLAEGAEEALAALRGAIERTSR